MNHRYDTKGKLKGSAGIPPGKRLMKKGVPVSPGVVVAHAWCVDEVITSNEPYTLEDSSVSGELNRFDRACRGRSPRTGRHHHARGPADRRHGSRHLPRPPPTPSRSHAVHQGQGTHCRATHRRLLGLASGTGGILRPVSPDCRQLSPGSSFRPARRGGACVGPARPRRFTEARHRRFRSRSSSSHRRSCLRRPP